MRATLEDGTTIPVVRLKRGEEDTIALKRHEPQGMDQEDWVITGVAGGTMAIMLIAGGKIVTTALMLSLLTTGGAIILWIKAPSLLNDIPGVGHVLRHVPFISDERRQLLLETNWKHKMEKHEFALDCAVSVGVVGIFGMTATGLIAAGMTGLGISTLFRLKRAFTGRPTTRMA
jgi:hypothetical protein